MKSSNKLILISGLALSCAPSSAIVIVLSDLVPAGATSPIETFLNNNFSNVTEIRHANYANNGAAATQDALNGTGAFAGSGAADVFMIGRSFGSAAYATAAAGHNSLNIPVVSLSSYAVRETGSRMGWHNSGATNNKAILGSETTVTAAGATILGLSEGSYDLLVASAAVADTFNGLGAGTTAYGGGQILATVGGDTLAAYWAAGAAPGNPTNAGVATFPAPRLLFNMDNDPTTLNDGTNDFANVSAQGLTAMVSAIEFATPLTSVPEPSTSLLGLAALGLIAVRRR